MSVYVSQHDIVSAYCLDEASGPGMWEIQRDIVEALRDHPTLTPALLMRSPGMTSRSARGVCPGPLDPSLN